MPVTSTFDYFILFIVIISRCLVKKDAEVKAFLLARPILQVHGCNSLKAILLLQAAKGNKFYVMPNCQASTGTRTCTVHKLLGF